MFVDVDGASLWVEREGQGIPVVVPTGGGVGFYRRTFSPRLTALARLQPATRFQAAGRITRPVGSG